MKRASIILFLAVAAFISFVSWRRPLPMTTQNNQNETLKQATTSGTQATSSNPQASDSRIEITNGVKHIVPLNEIIGGGPPKDGIPSIDHPKFISISAARSLLKDSEAGVAIHQNGVDRFYPFQILVWHEIVNDTINGQRVLITYCPLCRTAIVFDPLVKGGRAEFGTSGKLWNSNLVMYDRKTDSLWSQVLGEAIVGEMAGAKLAVLPSDLVLFGNWEKIHPNGEVLSRDTGAIRFYGSDPYGNYYTSPDIYFPVNNEDNRLDPKEFILGLVINGQAKAYLPGAIKKAGELEDQLAGEKLILKYEADIDAVRIFRKTAAGALERINPVGAYWFSWAAVHPQTELYQ